MLALFFLKTKEKNGEATMKEFTYTITDPLGIHARPAGMLVKCTKSYDSEIILCKGAQAADAKRLLSVMGLGIRAGDTVDFRITGIDEDAALAGIAQFCRETL